MFNLFRLCRKDEISFDIVAETGNIVAKNGNNVEATFGTVERIVQLVALDNVASTLLLVWTGLCGRADSSLRVTIFGIKPDPVDLTQEKEKIRPY